MCLLPLHWPSPEIEKKAAGRWELALRVGSGSREGASRRWAAARDPAFRNPKATGPHPPPARPRNPLVIPRDNSQVTLPS